MTDKPNPYDVEALESAVNDSATRVSTIWISFLIFSLYLLIAATTVTQRQLLLADPIKLPVLNIELPLWGFFFLAPILFVILHIYVLLQVLLLGRTTAAYNTAVARIHLSPEENISLRQRLANTLFAQIFAGSPRERDGFIGWLLRAIVWITLAIAPILILLAFQLSFLAYHSHIATWTHRLLILIELAAFFLIWPLALDAQKDFPSPKFRVDLKHLLALSWSFLGPYEQWHTGWLWLRQRPVPLVACLLFIVSLSIATFPGEPHVNLFTLNPFSSVQCDRWVQQQFGRIDLRFDRLDLPGIHVVDEDKLAKIVVHASERKLDPSGSERTQNFRDRDFNCSDLSSADLRRVDLASARLVGATLDSTALNGASLENTQLQDASLQAAHLEDAYLPSAQLQNTDLSFAHLQGAFLAGAQLQGASLFLTELQGANLVRAQLQGAMLDRARLQGAILDRARLRGAYLLDAQLQGASLTRTELQGALLRDARLEGATLNSAQLQGAFLEGTKLSYARLSDVYVWRAKKAPCHDSLVTDHKPGAIIEAIFDERKPLYMAPNPIRLVPSTPKGVVKFIDDSVADISDATRRNLARETMRAGLIVDPTDDDTQGIEEVWRKCEDAPDEPSTGEFNQKRAEFLRGLVCQNLQEGTAIARGIIRNFISNVESRLDFYPEFARYLLSQDGKECNPTKGLDEATINELRAAAAKATSVRAEPVQSSSPAVASPTTPAGAPLQPPAMQSTTPP